MMNIVLVCINNFQEYILDNIRQLINTGNNNIYVIINNNLYNFFNKYLDKISIIFIEDLYDEYDFYNKTKLDKNFRNGFWTLTSLRFFYLYSFMKKYNITNVIHLENDVLLYHNTNILLDKLNNTNIYIPFDTFNRNIASIIYIPNHNLLKLVLDNYDLNKNDMENFSLINKKTNIITNFPIFNKYNSDNLEIRFVSKNFNNINFIFDAAAIGQYLGGVDPRNKQGDTTGFINETCIIKYNNYMFIWKDKKPYIILDNIEIPIFNLHIHSKILNKFI
jgi:hypothetical protein